MTNTPRTPVLLVRTGPTEVTAVQAGRSGHAWLPLAQPATALLAPLLGAKRGTSVVGRTLTIRPDQIAEWDRLAKHGTDGYVYGMGWTADGKIGRNFQFKETTPTKSMTQVIDPLAIANAVATAKMNADIQALQELLLTVATDVKSVLHHLRLEEEAELLAAVETIDAVYSRYLAGDGPTAMDWERISHLEQILKRTHRMVLGEFEHLSELLAFENVDEASQVSEGDAARARDLVALELWLLKAITQWADLTLSVRVVRGEWSLASVHEMRSLVDDTVAQATRAIEQLHDASAERPVSGRSWWDQLWSDGIVRGDKKDKQIVMVATAERSRVHEYSVATPALEPAEPTVLTLVADLQAA